ncbi:MAG: hypothetical protein A2Z21_01010 [Candidatus Fraserbacteria bacterium RBG_16_55_9]|uniref:HicB-like antitoxin of toxin-antitoxin system domain-containing protein n=1 Tax=Fraserbacteria sp. (strain RBG_16_55_9) TaxID=1817864 RepID=A0A1F5URN7_FRAXR|nr:MAG: hypothetical protein A2Z21_01010 [Candidatus Fraserbacteria bacterium RBG_16_55_9]
MAKATPKTRLPLKQPTTGLNFQVTIVVEPDEDEFHAYCPALPGLHVAGATVQEALENAQVAAQLFLECMIEDGDAIPETFGPSLLKALLTDIGWTEDDLRRLRLIK